MFADSLSLRRPLRLRLSGTVEGDRQADELLERELVDLFSFVDVDRTAYASVKARVEETLRIVQSGALCKKVDFTTPL